MNEIPSFVVFGRFSTKNSSTFFALVIHKREVIETLNIEWRLDFLAFLETF